MKNIVDKVYTTQIKFIKRLRDNLKFDSFEKLKNQILEDIDLTNKYFKMHLDKI